MLQTIYTFQALSIPKEDWYIFETKSHSLTLNLDVSEDLVLFGIPLAQKSYKLNTGLVNSERKMLPFLSLVEAKHLIQEALIQTEEKLQLYNQIKLTSLMLNETLVKPGASDDLVMLVKEVDFLYWELGTLSLPFDFLNTLTAPFQFIKTCGFNLGRYITQNIEVHSDVRS